MRWRPSLAIRLTLWFGASAFLLVLASTLYLYWSLVSTLRYQNAQVLSDRLRTVRTLLNAGPEMRKELKRRIEKEWPERRFEHIYIRVLNANQGTLSQTPSLSAEMNKVLREAKHTTDASRRPFTKYFSLDESEEGFFARSEEMILADPAQTRFRVQIALDCRHEDRVLSDYRGKIYVLLSGAFLICVLVGWRIAKRGMAPIYRIARTTDRVNPSNLGERIQTADLPVELSSLADNFNSMLDRLEDSFGRLSRFSADLAHELRTPLNNMLGELQVTLGKPRTLESYQDALGSCLEECEKVSHIIDALLFLARSENPAVQLKKESVDVRRELQTVIDFYEASAVEAGIQCSVEAPEGILIHVERTLFQRAVGNLLSNAIKHSPGGKIHLSAIEEGKGVVIGVQDTGCGISSEDLPFVLDRFYRVDSSRSKGSGGSGLGLAIVKSVANIHGGSVCIESELGKGTRACLRLQGDQNEKESQDPESK